MNFGETMTFLRTVIQVCPGQAKIISGPNPDQAAQVEAMAFAAGVWQRLLADVEAPEATDALYTVVARRPFVSPAEVLAEVRARREERLEGCEIEPPDVDPDDVRAYLAALGARRRSLIRSVPKNDHPKRPTAVLRREIAP
jgi:hypothetical protein